MSGQSWTVGETFLIAGLGNPESEYALTRHNVGFRVTDLLAERWKASLRPESRFRARVAAVNLGEDRVYLCQPLTWMNLSGEAVAPLARYYHVELARVLVILDDADLPLGMVRLRPSGSTGGHHGLESVLKQVGTENVARLRVGIGDAGQRRIVGHVLGKFQTEEQPTVNKVLVRAADQAECWVRHGIQKAMNEFNGAVSAPEKREN